MFPLYPYYLRKWRVGWRGEFIQEGVLFDIMAHKVGTFLGEAAY